MNTARLPRIALYVLALLFLVLSFVILNELSFYLIPATFAALLAMLMLPLNRLLEKWRFPRVLAIVISLLVILVILGGIITLISVQVVNFMKDLPTIEQQLRDKFTDFQAFVQQVSGFTVENQMEFIDKETTNILSTADKWGTGILLSTGGTLAAFGIMILHFILFLLYRQRIKGFFLGLIDKGHHDKAAQVIEEITKVTRQYLTGVVIVMAIMSVLNSVGLLLLGIQNAIFFGVLAAILNIIPYIGVWIGAGLPIILALITKESFFYPIGVLGVFLFNQFIDNNFLTPRITGSQVKINALATVGVILIGNLVWGVAGMILFIPLLGIAKIVFDNVDQLKPFGFLIGEDETPKRSVLAKKMRLEMRKSNDRKEAK
ncbi:MAG: AI-2E family transporter [Chitinophagaceae bacterium]|nr:AI-2E family transporter [Chitinophagaceae bacterium]